MVVPKRDVDMSSPSDARTVPDVSLRTKPSRSLSSEILWRLQLLGTSLKPVCLTVSKCTCFRKYRLLGEEEQSGVC